MGNSKASQKPEAHHCIPIQQQSTRTRICAWQPCRLLLTRYQHFYAAAFGLPSHPCSRYPTHTQPCPRWPKLDSPKVRLSHTEPPQRLTPAETPKAEGTPKHQPTPTSAHAEQCHLQGHTQWLRDSPGLWQTPSGFHSKYAIPLKYGQPAGAGNPKNPVPAGAGTDRTGTAGPTFPQSTDDPMCKITRASSLALGRTPYLQTLVTKEQGGRVSLPLHGFPLSSVTPKHGYHHSKSQTS